MSSDFPEEGLEEFKRVFINPIIELLNNNNKLEIDKMFKWEL